MKDESQAKLPVVILHASSFILSCARPHVLIGCAFSGRSPPSGFTSLPQPAELQEMPDLHGVAETPEEGVVPGLRFALADSSRGGTANRRRSGFRKEKMRPATGGRRRSGRGAGGVGSWGEAAGERPWGVLGGRRLRAAGSWA